MSKSGFYCSKGFLVMKISLEWLKDYIETGLDAEQIAQILSDLGLPYEGIEYRGSDAVIDVEVTSNRGDCLGYIGIARELAAATGKELKIPAVELPESATADKSTKAASDFIGVEIAEPDLCYRYTARIIEGVKVGPSPDWLKNRLEVVGMRSVNNVVDATNYAMLETGQPPHAFDYETLKGGKIIVRKAYPGESIISIDGSKCELDADMLVIADAQRPVAIAGVMGGLETEVSDRTKTILLEDAYFKPLTVRTTARKLALPSEAAFRFERTVDIENIDWASKRTAQLIVQAAGGKVAEGIVDVYPKKPAPKKAALRLPRLKNLLGIVVPADDVMRILSKLGFKPLLKNSEISCSIPSWRSSDVYREADLIEEVARHYGYNKVPTGRKIQIEVVPADTRQKLLRSTGTYLNGCGFYETINVDFTDTSVAELFTAEGHLEVKDETRKNDNLLRRTLIGSLLGVLKTNLNAKNSPCKIFEIADTFAPNAEKKALPIEKTKLALVCDSDIRLLQGVIEGLIKSINSNARIIFSPADLVWAKVGARVAVDGDIIGEAGIISQPLKEKFDFKNAPCAAELDFEQLLALQTETPKVRPIPKFPAIVRDLSIIIDEQICWADIIAAINKKASSELEAVRFVGIYRGKPVPADKKSLTLSLLFRDEDGTLLHETVDRLQADILKGLTESVGAELRTL